MTRLSVVFGQIVALTVPASLLVCAMAPLVGQRYPVGDALVHSGILCVGGVGLYVDAFCRAARFLTRAAAAR